VAAIVLKPLRDAMRDGDPIQSVIRATAVNQDGQTPSVTVPSQVAQVRMINRVYADAGLDPRDTCYVEAHGKICLALLC
jgi:acyl transferase domain-containing protein